MTFCPRARESLLRFLVKANFLTIVPSVQGGAFTSAYVSQKVSFTSRLMPCSLQSVCVETPRSKKAGLFFLGLRDQGFTVELVGTVRT